MTAFGVWNGGILARLALRSQVRIVSALVRREMVSHYGESRLGYLWAFLGPTLQLIGVVVLFDLVMHRTAPLGRSTALFVLTGFVPYFLYSKIALYVSSAVAGNRSLLALPPIKPFDVILARVILEASTYLLVGFMMFAGLYFVGVAEAAPADFLTIIEACLLGIGFGLGVGMINIVLSGYFHNWMMFFSILNLPTWMLSGVWFLPEQVPEGFREWMLYNPIMHFLMLFRMGFYPDYRGEFLDMPYLLTSVGISFALGMAAMKVCARRVLTPL